LRRKLHAGFWAKAIVEVVKQKQGTPCGIAMRILVTVNFEHLAGYAAKDRFIVETRYA